MTFGFISFIELKNHLFDQILFVFIIISIHISVHQLVSISMPDKQELILPVFQL